MSEAKLQWCFLFYTVPEFSILKHYNRERKLKVEASGGRNRKKVNMWVKLQKAFELPIPFCLYIKNEQVTEVTVFIMSHKSLSPSSSMPEMNARKQILLTQHTGNMFSVTLVHSYRQWTLTSIFLLHINYFFR